MNREINSAQYTVFGPITVADPVAEIKAQAKSGAYQYLLALAHDGVIWGVIRSGRLSLSSDEKAFPERSPQLRAETLWEARLFGENSEWFLWRNEDGWLARQITDGNEGDNDVEKGEAFTESFILWGTDPGGRARGPFTPVREADLGICHTPPLKWNGRHQFRLLVKHYVAYDADGAAYIKLSRLMDLSNGGKR